MGAQKNKTSGLTMLKSRKSRFVDKQVALHSPDLAPMVLNTITHRCISSLAFFIFFKPTAEVHKQGHQCINVSQNVKNVQKEDQQAFQHACGWRP